MLYSTCKKENPNTHFISDTDEIKKDWFNNVSKVGVCGATSTPRWLMEKVALQIENY
jgi:4-hydroxy-3-methylbut-2-enyl diphosphate reductase